jgi:hypothetical protein
LLRRASGVAQPVSQFRQAAASVQRKISSIIRLTTSEFLAVMLLLPILQDL